MDYTKLVQIFTFTKYHKTIFKAVGEKKAVTSQPSRDRRVKEKNQRENHHENKHKTSRSTKMPSSHMVLAVSSLFICIFCWPAAPCAILATIYGIQVM